LPRALFYNVSWQMACTMVNQVILRFIVLKGLKGEKNNYPSKIMGYSAPETYLYLMFKLLILGACAYFIYNFWMAPKQQLPADKEQEDDFVDYEEVD